MPGLARIAWKEIDERAQRLGIPVFVVRTALRISSPDGRSYSERIDKATTEQELSEVFEDLIGLVPMGKSLFGAWNPVRTGGPMQVSIAFAQAACAGSAATPTHDPNDGSIRQEVFTRHGGMYFGIAHLLDYPASYDRHLYRFADFNAGHYASRNAAFQNALGIASGKPLALDGDLVNHAEDGRGTPGSTELAARSLGPRLNMSDRAIRDDLEQGDVAALRTLATLSAGLRACRAGSRRAPAARGAAEDQAPEPEDHPQPHHGSGLPSGWTGATRSASSGAAGRRRRGIRVERTKRPAARRGYFGGVAGRIRHTTTSVLPRRG